MQCIYQVRNSQKTKTPVNFYFCLLNVCAALASGRMIELDEEGLQLSPSFLLRPGRRPFLFPCRFSFQLGVNEKEQKLAASAVFLGSTWMCLSLMGSRVWKQTSSALLLNKVAFLEVFAIFFVKTNC